MSDTLRPWYTVRAYLRLPTGTHFFYSRPTRSWKTIGSTRIRFMRGLTNFDVNAGAEIIAHYNKDQPSVGSVVQEPLVLTKPK